MNRRIIENYIYFHVWTRAYMFAFFLSSRMIISFAFRFSAIEILLRFGHAIDV